MADASLSTSNAVLKVKYKDGVPLTNFQTFKYTAAATKDSTFKGKNKTFALQTESNQGIGPDVTTAQAVAAPTTFGAFTFDLVNSYSLARVRGDAIKRVDGDGALIKLWNTETDNSVKTHLKWLEICALRNGTGVVGTLSGGSIATTAVVLKEPADAANFDVGATYNVVDSATSLSPTLRASSDIVLQGIDRVSGTLTFNVAINTISGATVNDSLVRKGFNALAGVQKVMYGAQQWCAGGTTPGTFAGCNRNVDPVRLAGSVIDATGIGMSDALIEGEAAFLTQGFSTKNITMWVNPKDIKELKKSLDGKSFYPKTDYKTQAGLSFAGLAFEGESGEVKLMSNPFQPRGEVLVCDMAEMSFESSGELSHLQDYDDLKSIRSLTDDVYEARFATFGQHIGYSPYRMVRIQNWGAV